MLCRNNSPSSFNSSVLKGQQRASISAWEAVLPGRWVETQLLHRIWPQGGPGCQNWAWAVGPLPECSCWTGAALRQKKWWWQVKTHKWNHMEGVGSPGDTYAQETWKCSSKVPKVVRSQGSLHLYCLLLKAAWPPCEAQCGLKNRTPRCMVSMASAEASPLLALKTRTLVASTCPCFALSSPLNLPQHPSPSFPSCANSLALPIGLPSPRGRHTGHAQHPFSPSF